MDQLALGDAPSATADGRVLKLTVAYDGTDFHGFAAQHDQRTVEGVLSDALARVLRGPVELSCAGRTDAGVHAWGQVVSAPIALDADLDPAVVARSVSSQLGPEVVVRDAELVDQSDMIVSLIPELPSGVPGLSSGVERELHHAFEHTKEVYVVWKPKKNPSPFITETATRIFATVDEALKYFDSKGWFPQRDLFGN